MQTNVIEKYAQSSEGAEAEEILRKCVHCGFCTATCPTYQLLGDELDGPRGRIYLMKQVLEGQQVSRKTQLHLDRCLTCRSCETTCPSGVQYGRLVDIGRHIVEQQVQRPLLEKIMRAGLRTLLPKPALFSPLLSIGQLARPLLPWKLKNKIPLRQHKSAWPAAVHARKMLVLEGCVQSSATPNTNAAAARVLDKLGIQLMRASEAGCCGAVSHHLSAVDEGLNYMRRNIDAWWPFVQQGVEAIVMTASGCGAVVKDYGHLLAHDPNYADKAATIAGLARDLSEVIAEQPINKLREVCTPRKIAFHSPCTLQHGQQLGGKVEQILHQLGFELTEVRDPHLCCGSAGTYSILQNQLSEQLLQNKLKSLQADAPELIVTANVGCQMHMAAKADVPVRHWIELLD